MNTATQIICEDNGIEIAADFNYEVTPGYYEEPENVASWVEPTGYAELNHVFLRIGPYSINLLPQLSPGEKEEIIKKLVY